jgi:hypothetical protein
MEEGEGYSQRLRRLVEVAVCAFKDKDKEEVVV